MKALSTVRMWTSVVLRPCSQRLKEPANLTAPFDSKFTATVIHLIADPRVNRAAQRIRSFQTGWQQQ
ncbi:hypothetical protein M404DRAFT_1004920 [Pisolithus tinctorius Marx 270]|uniref:Uncharacterized protein n=1 Tax=Pisolithus tinctorius Marx 270 TaxID=870435 RepID=A0A0C3NVL4_PISTI|nr:hypothetical protein M404DRAFT_1004920 [Pisolithus tinctorius Marx 270]